MRGTRALGRAQAEPGAVAGEIRFSLMPVYRVLRFQGSLLLESAMLEAADHVAAVVEAGRLSKADRLELWLDNRQVAVLSPSRAGQRH